MTARTEAESDPPIGAEQLASRGGLRRDAAVRALRIAAAVRAQFASSLTRRIVTLNLGGLLVLVLGFLFLSQLRADLIGARIESLKTQAGIIAAAIGASASVEGDGDRIQVDPEKLLQSAPGAAPAAPAGDEESIEFAINPEQVGPLLHKLVSPTHIRARIYDREGVQLLDSRGISVRSGGRGEDAKASDKDASWPLRTWRGMSKFFFPDARAPSPETWVSDGKNLPTVADALSGTMQSVVSVNGYGETIVYVGAPIQGPQTVRGALLLSTRGGDIDGVLAAERWGLLRIFAALAVVMTVLSVLQANTIAEPVRRLAAAAERVRRGVKSRRQLPEFPGRSDEIGHLSQAMREMTNALYDRMEAIESFAADVAHELKNPLTSLRSAMEVLPRVEAPASRARLIEVMQHDVRRLDRLITDISDASRLDAELARADARHLDVAELVGAVVSMTADSPRGRGVALKFTIEGSPPSAHGAKFAIVGHDSRLAQVFTNLIDNARSFSDTEGEVRIDVARSPAEDRPGGFDAEIVVDDDGPGIPEHALERIFERFYTDRPSQGFGQNSGLGLSISRQIVEAHGGTIAAFNRPGPTRPEAEDGSPRHSAGARFRVRLPLIEG